MGKCLLLTGGAGFIGSNCIHYLLANSDYEVVNFDKLTYAGNLENLAAVANNPRYCFVQGDIADRGAVEAVFREKRPVAVLNFAAESHVDRSIHDPGLFLQTNVLGTQVLLEAARTFGVKKFVQISTDEVYGSLPPSGYFNEETPLAPNSPYSASKAGADLLARAYYHTYRLPVCITRCSNNYGPYQYPEKLIPLMLIRALQDQPLPVYGDGGNIRDWLYVEDHCRAVHLVLEQGRPGEVYNIGGHNELTNLELVRRLLALLGKPESLITFVEDRPGHDRRYAIDAGKIERELGWTPQVSFEEGLRRTVAWYLENREWWERIQMKKEQRAYALPHEKL